LGSSRLLFMLAAVGWWWTANRMQGMDDGPWTDLGALGWFVGVWVVMMAAMMFPSVSPTVALYSRMTRQRSFFFVWASAAARSGFCSAPGATAGRAPFGWA
jgi:predicted metal-binding membrane protein